MDCACCGVEEIKVKAIAKAKTRAGKDIRRQDTLAHKNVKRELKLMDILLLNDCDLRPHESSPSVAWLATNKNFDKTVLYGDRDLLSTFKLGENNYDL